MWDLFKLLGCKKKNYFRIVFGFNDEFLTPEWSQVPVIDAIFPTVHGNALWCKWSLKRRVSQETASSSSCSLTELDSLLLIRSIKNQRTGDLAEKLFREWSPEDFTSDWDSGQWTVKYNLPLLSPVVQGWLWLHPWCLLTTVKSQQYAPWNKCVTSILLPIRLRLVINLCNISL